MSRCRSTTSSRSGSWRSTTSKQGHWSRCSRSSRHSTRSTRKGARITSRRGRGSSGRGPTLSRSTCFAGQPMPLQRKPVRSNYRILISRGATRPKAKLATFNVRQPIPSIPIPLLPEDGEPELDLGAVLHALYDRCPVRLALELRRSRRSRRRARGWWTGAVDRGIDALGLNRRHCEGLRTAELGSRRRPTASSLRSLSRNVRSIDHATQRSHVRRLDTKCGRRVGL